jgi:hypothetical protein
LKLHNGILASPLNQYSRLLKDITSKQKKTIADHERIAHIEFLGALYPQPEYPWKNGQKYAVIIPGAMLRKVMIEGARKDKLGKQVEAGVLPPEDAPLLYDGPNDPEKLWDAGFHETVPVGQGRGKIIRTRPYFATWAIEPIFEYAEDLVQGDQLLRAIQRAGREVGMGDDRPLFGLFTAEAI